MCSCRPQCYLSRRVPRADCAASTGGTAHMSESTPCSCNLYARSSDLLLYLLILVTENNIKNIEYYLGHIAYSNLFIFFKWFQIYTCVILQQIIIEPQLQKQPNIQPNYSVWLTHFENWHTNRIMANILHPALWLARCYYASPITLILHESSFNFLPFLVS